jgi:hypothetical protein
MNYFAFGWRKLHLASLFPDQTIEPSRVDPRILAIAGSTDYLIIVVVA